MNNKCISVYQKKIELYNTILERMNVHYQKSDVLKEHKKNFLNNQQEKENNVKYELIYDLENTPNIGELNSYLPKFMECLWKQPKIVCKLLLKANSNELKDNLSNLFCNNFYENLLSSNYTEHNLLFLIALLLKEEINPDKSNKYFEPKKCLDSFLNNSACGFILEQMHKKKDIQTFFNNILIDIIQNLEISSANKEFVFDLNKIEQEIKLREKNKESLQNCPSIKNKTKDNLPYETPTPEPDSEQTLSPAPTLTQETKETPTGDEEDLFNSYLSIPTFEYLMKFLSNHKLVNKEIIVFIKYLIEENDYKKGIYSPELFKKSKGMDESLFQLILDEYKNSFDIIVNIIDKLFENLVNNIYLVPYSLKCICKIIFHLIQKKYNTFNIIHQYAFMSKFIFEKLFNPIFQNPELGALINSFILSTTTIKNLEIVSKIIMNFVSGKLFKNNKEEGYFVPFNSYFLNKISNLINFYKGILNVDLPPFIDSFIKDELPENFEYNYFNENPNEVVFHRSVCFTAEDLSILLDIMDKNKKNIFINDSNEDLKILQKTFEKLTSKKCKEIINYLKNEKDYEIIEIPIYDKNKPDKIKSIEQKKKKKIKYYLISEINFNHKYQDIFSIEQETKYFFLSKKNEDKEDNIQNTLLKIKNLFCNILYHNRQLVITDFKENQLSNTISILKEMKKLMKSPNYLIDESFPSEWFIDLLLDYLNKIPSNEINDDCKELLNGIQDKINQSIYGLKFEDFSLLIEKINILERTKNYYDKTKNYIIDIYLNKKVQNIVEKEKIEVEISYKYNDKKNELLIQKIDKNEKHLSYLDSIFDGKKKKASKECKTIRAFIENFPKLNKNQRYKMDALQYNKELKVINNIEKYFKIVKEEIKNTLKIKNEKEFMDINAKIYDYVMGKLYDKLYIDNKNKDEIIHENCKKLNWVEINHFIDGTNNYLIGSLLPDLTNYLRLITKKKSIQKKFINLEAIFDRLKNLGKYNSEINLSFDEQIKLLYYVFIKANPQNIYSDFKYMKLFLGNGNYEIEEQYLDRLMNICENILNLSSSKLNGIEDKNFIKKFLYEDSKIKLNYIYSN